jgi:acyl-CoA thioesterase-2
MNKHDVGDPRIALEERLTLDAIAPGHWRSRHSDRNHNGRCYGGQLLGQAVCAALHEAPPGRHASAVQFLFLSGAMPEQAVDFEVTRLQEGKRFTSLHVRGSQGDRRVLDAQVSAAAELPGPVQAVASPVPAGERPEQWPTLDELPDDLLAVLFAKGGYGSDRNAAIEFRIPTPALQLAPAHARPAFRYWMRARPQLSDAPALHAGALAYLSDWWLNFAAIVAHVPPSTASGMYIASLNHALWWHAPARADAWIHVSAQGAHAGRGRAMATAHLHDAQGRHIATATQECLAAYLA